MIFARKIYTFLFKLEQIFDLIFRGKLNVIIVRLIQF